MERQSRILLEIYITIGYILYILSFIPGGKNRGLFYIAAPLLIIGGRLLVKKKGHSPKKGFWILFPIVGLIYLTTLPNKNKKDEHMNIEDFNIPHLQGKVIKENGQLDELSLKLNHFFILEVLKDKYGYNPKMIVSTPYVMKLILILELFNIRSERELMLTLPMRLDWLFFLGLDLNDKVPDFNVLSNVRNEVGDAVFKSIYDRIINNSIRVKLLGHALINDILEYKNFVKKLANENIITEKLGKPSPK